MKFLFNVRNDEEMAAKFGAIHLRVFTVGDDYPVAYYIAINAGNLSNTQEYEADYLGFGPKSEIPTTVKIILPSFRVYSWIGISIISRF